MRQSKGISEKMRVRNLNVGEGRCILIASSDVISIEARARDTVPIRSGRR